MKLLSVQKLLSVRNFYQYETFIDGTFIGTKLLNFFLSVQWLLNFYRYNGGFKTFIGTMVVLMD